MSLQHSRLALARQAVVTCAGGLLRTAFGSLQ